MYTAKVAIEYGKITDGFFKAGLVPKEVGPGGGTLAFLPKGVSLTGSVMSSPNEKADDQSDKSKDRIWGGQSLYGTTDDSYFFYKLKLKCFGFFVFSIVTFMSLFFIDPLTYNRSITENRDRSSY